MKHSDATKEKQRFAAMQKGRHRRASILQSLRAAMREIAAKIRNSGGLYPEENGLSLAELCRCAGISETTIQQDSYARVKVRVDRWLKRCEPAAQSAAVSSRRSVAERLAHWRERYNDLLTTHLRDADLWIEERRLRLEAEAKVQELESLLAKLTRSNVVSLSTVPQRSGAASPDANSD